MSETPFDTRLMKHMIPTIRQMVRDAHGDGHVGDHIVSSLTAACVCALGAEIASPLLRRVAIEGFAETACFWADHARQMEEKHREG